MPSGPSAHHTPPLAMVAGGALGVGLAGPNLQQAWGHALHGSTRPLMLGLAFWTAAAGLVAWTLVRRALR